jgi:membrane fusion protein, multidrug efflux system
MKKIIIFVVSILAIVCIGIIYKAVNKSNQATTTSVLKLVSVKTTPVIVGNIEGEMDYTGTVEGINEAIIVSQTAGTVTKMNAIVGKRCSNSQVLAVIHNVQQDAAVQQAKAQLLAAENNLDKAKLDLGRIERLFKEKVSTQDNLELAQLNVKSAEAQVKAAEAGLKSAQKQLDDTYIKATIPGFIASKDIDLGATVVPGTKVAQVVDISKFKIKIMVSETDAVKMQTGKSVTVKIDALPNQVFEGKVLTIGLCTQDGMRSYPVEVVIENKAQKLPIKSGMFARCIINIESKVNAVIVPENAIIINNDGSANVFVAENGKAVLKNVILGIKNSGKYEIVSGLDASAKIIIDGKERVKDGIEIKEIN